MGLQFFKYCLGLSPFGKHDIIPNLWEIGSSFFRKIRLIAFKIKRFRSFQKNLKNSTVKPSLPGDLLFFIFFRTSRTSFSEISASNDLDTSGSKLGISTLIISSRLIFIKSESAHVYRFS